MKVFAFGASRNTAYETSLEFLKAGHTVTYLLRNASVFDNNDDIKPFIASGHARLVKGDALDIETVKNGWAEATKDGPVDLVLFAIGGTPSVDLTKGFVVTPPNLVSLAIFNVLATFPNTPGSPQPKFIGFSSHGVTKDTHATLPLLVKPLYALIRVPHTDKLEMERVIYHSAGWKWNEGEEPSTPLLPPGWQSRLPSPGWLKSAIILRPAIMTNGESKGKYRVDTNLTSCYTISRKDIAHFIAGDCIENWAKYENKGLSIGY
ncbi:hypothetical protein FRC03_012287 [Tulasnella sp. 419]|nr:hypothetical protein FRC02_007302 [Tulasnella sp. 418]KAG8952055.1 hypothetical protein FRC03_012287 [Tulasnella sp. 419]